MSTLHGVPTQRQVADLDDQGIAHLALAQLAAYVTGMDRMSGRQRKLVRDALANAVEGVTSNEHVTRSRHGFRAWRSASPQSPARGWNKTLSWGLAKTGAFVSNTNRPAADGPMTEPRRVDTPTDNPA